MTLCFFLFFSFYPGKKWTQTICRTHGKRYCMQYIVWTKNLYGHTRIVVVWYMGWKPWFYVLVIHERARWRKSSWLWDYISLNRYPKNIRFYLKRALHQALYNLHYRALLACCWYFVIFDGSRVWNAGRQRDREKRLLNSVFIAPLFTCTRWQFQE